MVLLPPAASQHAYYYSMVVRGDEEEVVGVAEGLAELLADIDLSLTC